MGETAREDGEAKTVADVLLEKDRSLVPQISDQGWAYLRGIPVDAVAKAAGANARIATADARLEAVRKMHRQTCARLVRMERLAKELERIGKWIGNWRDAHRYDFPQQGDGVTVAMLVQQLATRLHHEIVRGKEDLTIDGPREIELKNEGAEIAAEKLRKIAETGNHPGVFGSVGIERAAQAILRLHRNHKTMGFGQGKGQ